MSLFLGYSLLILLSHRFHCLVLLDLPFIYSHVAHLGLELPELLMFVDCVVVFLDSFLVVLGTVVDEILVVIFLLLLQH
jgi:hypothetical protein